MNLLRRNPRMTMAGVVLVIVLVAVVIWMVTRDKKPESTGPQLEVTGEKIVKSTKVSEYAYRKMEYADPAPAELRGWNIDFTITIETKGGFKEAGINAIKIVRHKVTTTTESSGVDTDAAGDVLDTQYIDNISNYGTFETTFPGSALTDHAVGMAGGKNMFKLYGVKTMDDASTTGDDEEVLYTGTGTTAVVLASTVQGIPEADLNYTLDNASKVAFTFNLGSDSRSTLPNIESSIIRTKYRISIDPSNIYSLVPATDSGVVVANKYKFKKEDETFLTADATDVFKIDMSYGQGTYRAYTDDGNILTRVGGTGALVLKSPTDMNKAESETSLMTFSELGELDGVRIIGLYPGDMITPDKAIGNVTQLFWVLGSGTEGGVALQGNAVNFFPSEGISSPYSGNSKEDYMVTFETINKDTNTYLLKDGRGNYVSYNGNRTRKRTTKVDLSYAVTFVKQTTGDDQIQKYIMKDTEGNTFWLGDNWMLNGSDVSTDTPDPVVVFKFETGKPDGSKWNASPMTYYSCASDKDVGCNGAPSETNAGQGTGYVNQSCYAGSYMYC